MNLIPTHIQPLLDKRIPAALVALVCTLPAWAGDKDSRTTVPPPQPCSLARVASLDVSRPKGDLLAVPVSIAGVSHNFILTFQGATAVNSAIAQQLKLKVTDLMGFRPQVMRVMGVPMFELVTVPDFAIGSAHSDSFEMFSVGDNPFGGSYTLPWAGAADGIIGTSLLKNFDVEVDLKANKLNLYKPSLCDGGQIYWASSYATVPFQLDPMGNVFMQMQLDGKNVSVGINMLAGKAAIGTTVLEKVFGIKEESLTPISDPSGGEKLYKYPFKTLTLGGLTINNPDVVVYHDTPSQQCEGKKYGNHICVGGFDMEIGLNELRALHVYMSFGNQEMYVTGADAHL